MKHDRILPEKLDPPLLDPENELDEEELFRRAMQDVKPLAEEPSSRRTAPRARLRARQRSERVNPLLEFLQGQTEIEWSCHPGYVEGGAQRWNRPLLKKLLRGGFSIQAELDLHGHYQEQARMRLEEFLLRCCRRHLHCVRIIHGKGKNSPGNRPVLKLKVTEWLSQERLSKYVVLFASAPPSDGGAGALYVLLRKKPDKVGRS